MPHRSLRAASLAALLVGTACHCDDECRSAAECASGICREGRCAPPTTPDDGGDASTDGGDASAGDGG